MAVDRNSIKAIVQEVLNEQAQDVDSLTVAESVEGVNSLPAFQGSEMVLVPLAALKGERGEKGEAGERGEKGEQGAQGERGEQGLQGVQGERGEQGLQGVQGERGEKGEPGDSRFSEELNKAITEFKDKKIIAEDATTTVNGDTKELTLQAGKVYTLLENVDKLRIKAPAPPENAKEVAEVMLYFHTGQNSGSGVVARSGGAPMISFEGVALPKDMTIEKNMFYEVSFKYNPIARKYTALVASWAIGD